MSLSHAPSRMLFKMGLILCAAYAAQASSSQRKYDGSTLSYDPKGRMFQVEYAIEATRRGRTAVGVCGEDCVALVTRDPPSSSPSKPSSCRAVAGLDGGGVWAVDTHVGITASGLRSDIQYVVDCARTWCSEHRFIFGAPMPCHILARRLADLIHSCTTRGGKRPLAVDILLGGTDEHAGASLHQVQATGAFQRYRAVAAGGGGVEATARLASAVAAAAAERAQEEESVRRRKGRGTSPGDAMNRRSVPADPATVVDRVVGGVSGGEGRGDGGEDDVEDDTKTAAAAGDTDGAGEAAGEARKGWLGGEREGEDRRRRRRPLEPEHREPSIGGGGGGGVGRRGNGASYSAGRNERREYGEDEHGKRRGGLRASELSAAIYGGGGGGGVDGEWDGEDGEREGAWEQGVGCTQEDFEEILLELQAEEEEEEEQ
ncbi:unnamed protein product [Pylaiella littoralis]